VLSRACAGVRPGRWTARHLWGAVIVAVAAAPVVAAPVTVTQGTGQAETVPPKTGPSETVRSGTAFFVSPHGSLLTSAHVVTGCQQISVWLPGGSGLPAKLVTADRQFDIALLAIEGAHASDVVPLGLRQARAGEPGFSIAFGVDPALPREAVLASGSVVGPGSAPNIPRVTVLEMKVDAGTSGAPVLDARGALIGLIIGRYTDKPELAVAVPADDVSRFLVRQSVRISSGASGGPAMSAEARLRGMSALVQCVPMDTTMQYKAAP
jgi:S1-C subfamily serine protease